LTPSPLAALALLLSLGRGIAEREVPFLRTSSIRRLRLRDGRSFYVRGNGWDTYTFFEIFIKGVYDSALPLSPDGMVVDLGSNIGATCAYWRTRAPGAPIVAVEPAASNAGMLRLNLGADAAVEDAAVSDESGWAQFDEGERSTGHHLTTSGSENGRPAGALGTRTITPDDIMRAHRPTRIGLLKVDIEGAEESVFTRSWELLGITDKIVMEIHHPAIRPRIVAALAEQGFEHRRPAGPRDMADLFVRRDGGGPSA
jgi:FkbM family methyltransferase